MPRRKAQTDFSGPVRKKTEESGERGGPRGLGPWDEDLVLGMVWVNLIKLDVWGSLTQG